MTARKAAILLATYNGERYLPEMLESLAAQTRTDFDLVVRDDGSTDGTLRLLEEWSGRLSIRLLPRTERLGAAGSFMRLLAESGDGHEAWFLADQDDVWKPEKVERAMARLAAHGEGPALYCAGFQLVDAALAPIGASRPPRVLGLENALVENVATGCTCALNARGRRAIVDHLPGRVLMHDWWYYIVLSAVGTVIYDDWPSLLYRQHGGNVIGGAAGFYEDLSRRVSRFLAQDAEGIFGVSAQAAEVERCLGPLLSPEQRELVRALVRGKGSFLRRAGLAVSSPFARQRALDTAILRVLFLLGRF